ncbi:MAG: hypothetical protein RI562_06355 [Salibacter sp.]|uniref:hypothetical protein n=1 Tax=Salibacter sp. TaxID=2010995 RepID=UPI0028708F8C|nr:hypothetical protein [Salibacter sp.]MDR9398666.1 hypothetical protein [Salibacter sp.]
MEKMEQGFVVDRLTDSILNTISGDSFQTEISTLKKSDINHLLQNDGWKFDWKTEFNDMTREVYKLTIVNNPDIIQGLISVYRETDHVFINLLENAPFNIGKKKLYEGVPGNLVAYACKLSFQIGFEGFVAFTAKSKLIKHYEDTLGAYHFKNQRMIIPTEAAKNLVIKYFKTS